MLRHADAVSTSDNSARPPATAAGPALDVVLDLGSALEQLTFPLELPEAQHARDLRRRVHTQLTSHLAPRLKHASLPAVVVVGGPTGSGKSTLVNTISKETVSPAGVVRPTTRKPVLVVNPADEELMAQHPVAERSRLVVADGLPRGLALVDAPDLDSVHEENRTLAVELVEVADIWLFVTTANRYGDALPWEILETVRRRGVTVGVVLDRVGVEAMDTVRRDLLQRLDSAGLSSVPLFVVPDAGPLTEALEEKYVTEVSSWLTLIASRAGSREVVARTIRGVWTPLRQEVRELLEAVVAQVETAADLTAAADVVVAPVAADLADDLRSGVLAEGAPTTRWLAGASSRGPLEALPHEATGYFAKRRSTRGVQAREEALGTLLEEVRWSFSDIVGQSAQRVSDLVRQAWAEHSQAGAVLAEARTAKVAAEERERRLDEAWRAWLETVGKIHGAARQGGGGQRGADLLTRQGEHLLLALAAVGLDGAVRSARRLLADSETLIERARTALVAAGQAVLAEEAAAFANDVTAELAPEAATELRVRVGELRRLAGED